MLLENLFYETALILAASAFLGALALKFRQPLIVAFIAVGILVGPSGLDLVGIDERLGLLAEIGIAILLFVVGLKLDLHLIRTMGPVAMATGLGQVAFTSLFGFFIAQALGFSIVGALYVAVALTFSSTIIIVKLLSDKREIDALHGRIAVGFLIVQDIAVILAMIGLTALGAGEATGHLWIDGLLVLLKGAFLIGGVALLMRFVLPYLLPHLARTQELLLLFAIAWAIFLAAVGDFLDFSKEVGAFLAGVSLASTAFRETIASRLVSLRDFLLLFFFIGLGAQLDLSMLEAQVVPALIFSAFVLIGNPLIVMAIMGFMGYRKRTGFLAGLTVAQISEFSLILGALGVSLGHIDRETLGLITLVGLITIGLSTYLILYSHPIYQRISPFLGIFERRVPYREAEEESGGEPEKVDVILFGLGRYGRNIAENLVRRGKRVLAVDFDPEVVSAEPAKGISVRYGAVEDPEILEHLPFRHSRWVVNAIPGREPNLSLLHALREKGYPGKIVLTAHNRSEAETYRQAGANKVLWPFVDAAEQAVDYLTDSREEFTELTPWPVTLEEVKLRPDSLASGKKIGDLSLRSRTGASVVAVDRAGRSHFDPGSDFLLLPGDRLVLLGTEEGLKMARRLLEEVEAEAEEKQKFHVAEIPLDSGSSWSGKTLTELDFRHRHGISVIGLQRGEERILSPSPEETLRPHDILLVLGHPDAIRECLKKANSEERSFRHGSS
ncbi:cation:proton antiporter [Desulfuromonas sp. TF]|uniref:cation:proton antiporter domain-containing protein n=1 Tax=Desulfuromonas sp. TF TaxID=1232410 RepID=UPI0004146A2E|nr:cation:proton antiporter [Desulfuromonas sp. TF]